MTAPSKIISGQSAFTFGTGGYSPAAGTCTAGKVLIARVMGITANGDYPAASVGITDDGTRQWNAWSPGLIQNGSINYRLFGVYFWALAGSGGSITVTVDATNSIEWWTVAVYEGDYDTDAPFGATGSDGNITDPASITITLNGTPASDSVTIGSLITSTSGAATISEGAAFQMMHEFDGASGNCVGDEYDDTTPGTTVTWTDPCVGSTIDSNGYLALGVELLAGGAPPVSFTVPVATLTMAGVQPALSEAPNAPTNLQGTAGDQQVALTWDAPAFDGGSAITDYVVQYRPHQ